MWWLVWWLFSFKCGPMLNGSWVYPWLKLLIACFNSTNQTKIKDEKRKNISKINSNLTHLDWVTQKWLIQAFIHLVSIRYIFVAILVETSMMRSFVVFHLLFKCLNCHSVSEWEESKRSKYQPLYYLFHRQGSVSFCSTNWDPGDMTLINQELELCL